jgi:hypothetical protein
MADRGYGLKETGIIGYLVQKRFALEISVIKPASYEIAL